MEREVVGPVSFPDKVTVDRELVKLKGGNLRGNLSKLCTLSCIIFV